MICLGCNMKHKNIGGSFEDLLKEENIEIDMEEIAKRIQDIKLEKDI